MERSGLAETKLNGRILALFIAGFLAGLALIYIGQESFVGNADFLDSYSVGRMGVLDIDNSMLFFLQFKGTVFTGCAVDCTDHSGSGKYCSKYLSGMGRVLCGHNPVSIIDSLWHKRNIDFYGRHFPPDTSSGAGIPPSFPMVPGLPGAYPQHPL